MADLSTPYRAKQIHKTAKPDWCFARTTTAHSGRTRDANNNLSAAAAIRVYVRAARSLFLSYSYM